MESIDSLLCVAIEVCVLLAYWSGDVLTVNLKCLEHKKEKRKKEKNSLPVFAD